MVKILKTEAFDVYLGKEGHLAILSWRHGKALNKVQKIFPEALFVDNDADTIRITPRTNEELEQMGFQEWTGN